MSRTKRIWSKDSFHGARRICTGSDTYDVYVEMIDGIQKVAFIDPEIPDWYFKPVKECNDILAEHPQEVPEGVDKFVCQYEKEWHKKYAEDFSHVGYGKKHKAGRKEIRHSIRARNRISAVKRDIEIIDGGDIIAVDFNVPIIEDKSEWWC